MRASLFKAAGLYAGASIINGVLPFVLLPVLTRYLPPSDFALTVMFTTFATFAVAFTGLNLNGAVNVRFFREPDKPFPVFVSTCCALVVLSTLLTSIVIFAVSPIFSSLVGLSAIWLLGAVLFSGCQSLVQIRLVCWQARQLPIHYTTFQIALTFVTAGLSLVLVVPLLGGWQGRVGAQVLVMLVFAALATVLLARDGLIRLKFDRDSARTALQYGIPLIPHGIGALLIAMSDRVIVASRLGLHEAGIYSAGMQIGMVTSLLADAFNRAYNPWLYSRLAAPDPHVRREVVSFTYKYFVAALVVGVGIGAAAPLFASVLLGSRYGEAAKFSFWISIGGSFQGMYYMVGLLIAYAQKTHWLAAVTIAGGLVNIPLTIFMVQTNGALGASQAFALVQAVFFLGTWALSMKVFQMPWFRS